MKQVIKNKIADLFIEKTGQVLTSFPSLYSKDDVHTLLVQINNAIDTILENEFANGVVDDSVANNGEKFTIEQIKGVLNNVDYSDFTDFEASSAEFSLNYNEIELDRVDVNVNQRELISYVCDELRALVEEDDNNIQSSTFS